MAFFLSGGQPIYKEADIIQPAPSAVINNSVIPLSAGNGYQIKALSSDPPLHLTPEMESDAAATAYAESNTPNGYKVLSAALSGGNYAAIFGTIAGPGKIGEVWRADAISDDNIALYVANYAAYAGLVGFTELTASNFCDFYIRILTLLGGSCEFIDLTSSALPLAHSSITSFYSDFITPGYEGSNADVGFSNDKYAAVFAGNKSAEVSSALSDPSVKYLFISAKEYFINEKTGAGIMTNYALESGAITKYYLAKYAPQGGDPGGGVTPLNTVKNKLQWAECRNLTPDGELHNLTVNLIGGFEKWL